jgi:hypothetical protein
MAEEDQGRQEFEADPGPWHHLPCDVVHQIVACLPGRDICSLQSSSRYLWALCSADVVWFHLFRKRWASTAPAAAISSSRHLQRKESPKRRLCGCSLARPCCAHSLFKPPGEVFHQFFQILENCHRIRSREGVFPLN